MRYTRAAAAAVALAVAVTGCGNKKKDDAGAKPADPAKIVVWQMGDGSPEQKPRPEGMPEVVKGD